MEILKFFNENKNSSYKYIENILKTQYKLELRMDKSNDYFIISPTNESDFNNALVRQCSGIIIEKKSYNILHYFGEIAYDINNNLDNNNIIEINDINIEKCLISSYINGYIIKIFKYKKTWRFATSKHTNIRKYKIKDKNITLYGMFIKCILKTFDIVDDFLNNLDDSYCYSFLLNNNKIFFINKVHISKLEEYYNLNNFKPLLNINNINSLKIEMCLIIEKIDENKNRKIRLSIDDIKNIFNKNKICLYNNKCFNKYCKFNHLITPDIKNNYKEYIKIKREINPLFKTQICKNGDKCKKNMNNKCIFIHKDDYVFLKDINED